ncbi:complement component 1 Q subcomponent-binding protein, mitochondrial-like [Octopus sinensis]|uniref:Complement component 1 Q subcomponent-binding protein, mitochondrial-like n=1 Tax=Octopus sinensis TaxID=2607531 RepID=A0A6P7UA54_9MOLL|nr:complement component 1 Q subcomponent-binding protein, mitochondrial-like [Octopus sinensis]
MINILKILNPVDKDDFSNHEFTEIDEIEDYLNIAGDSFPQNYDDEDTYNDESHVNSEEALKIFIFKIIKHATLLMFSSIVRRLPKLRPQIIPKLSNLTQSVRLMSTTKNPTNSNQFLSLIKEKIRYEKDSMDNEPISFPGFEVTLKGSYVELSKNHESEQITVSFHVNDSIESDYDTQEDETENSQFKLQIKLTEKCYCNAILMTISKKVNNQMVVGFNSCLVGFVIESVAFNKSGDLTDMDYQFFDCSNQLDSDIYDYLMDFLEARGIGSDFASLLCDFSTKYEHGLYTKFLGDMYGFMDDCERP